MRKALRTMKIKTYCDRILRIDKEKDAEIEYWRGKYLRMLDHVQKVESQNENMRKDLERMSEMIFGQYGEPMGDK